MFLCPIQVLTVSNDAATIWRRGKPDALLHHSDIVAASTPASSSNG
jgi:hypothetical protein